MDYRDLTDGDLFLGKFIHKPLLVFFERILNISFQVDAAENAWHCNLAGFLWVQILEELSAVPLGLAN